MLQLSLSFSLHCQHTPHSEMLRPRGSKPPVLGTIRSIRPPLTRTSWIYQLQPFTNISQHLLLSNPPGRPQLPFLSPVSGSRPVPPLSINIRQHFARLISTERRDYYKRRLTRGVGLGLLFSAVLFILQMFRLGYYQDKIEHKWPTPPEWTFISRWCLRSAQALQHPEAIGNLTTNWPRVISYLQELIGRLENIDDEGKGIVETLGEESAIEGVGKMGLAISGKSEPWRRGYFQALMGLAKAAENLDGWLTDTKQNISAPAQYVVGPSNLRPKPMPAGQERVPKEEDCVPASPSPELFYVKILTTEGFSERQKVDAALAYADWLDYKGLRKTAGNVYRRAINIAASGLLCDAEKVIDLKTGILKNNGKDMASENIIRVSTALGVRHARQGELPMALSILTSVLKARRSLPPSDEITTKLPSPSTSTGDPFSSIIDTLKIMFVPVEYPPPPPSGNESPLRTHSSICDEAGLMTYIGEIIYSTSSKENGLAWTRDAVDMAEQTILELQSNDYEMQEKCAECLKVALKNWRTMISILLRKAETEESKATENAKSSWLPFSANRQVRAKSLERKRWEAEKLIVDDRARRIWPVIEGESELGIFAPGSSLFVL